MYLSIVDIFNSVPKIIIGKIAQNISGRDEHKPNSKMARKSGKMVRKDVMKTSEEVINGRINLLRELAEEHKFRHKYE